MIDVIKEYLVSLGMSVDKKSFEDAEQTIQSVEEGAKKFANTSVKSFAIAGTAITTALATASIGIYAFLSRLATADLETEKFARKMWMSKSAAEELNNTLQAMDATIEDLYLSPELMGDFKTLRATIKDMKPPPEFADQMKFIRTIQFEFQRMRLEATYGLQWIGFYLYKYLEGPLKNIRGGLQGFNDAIVKGMPKWTKNVAQFLSWIARLGVAFSKGGRDVFRLFSKLGDHIPDKLKLVGAALLALGLILKTGPFGIVFAILTGLLLLLDDFYTYLEGGESALEPLWRKLQDFFQLLKDTGVIFRFGEEFDNALQTIESGIKGALDWLIRLYNKFDDTGAISNFKDGVVTNFRTATQAVKDFFDWFDQVIDDLNKEGLLSDLEDSFVGLGTEVSEIYKGISQFVDKLYGLEETKEVLDWIGNFIEGKLKFGLQTINDTIKTVTFTLKSARAFLTGDDELLEQAKREFYGEEENSPRPDSNGNGFKTLNKDVLQDAKDQATRSQDTRVESSINSLPRGMEPSFKKAINESELVKGFRTFSQDLNNGFVRMAMMINPDLFQQYEAMTGGTYANSYMYSTNNTTTRQTLIYNTGNPIFQIHSTDPKGTAQEVNEEWGQFNLRSMRNVY